VGSWRTPNTYRKPGVRGGTATSTPTRPGTTSAAHACTRVTAGSARNPDEAFLSRLASPGIALHATFCNRQSVPLPVSLTPEAKPGGYTLHQQQGLARRHRLQLGAVAPLTDRSLNVGNWTSPRSSPRSTGRRCKHRCRPCGAAGLRLKREERNLGRRNLEWRKFERRELSSGQNRPVETGLLLRRR